MSAKHFIITIVMGIALVHCGTGEADLGRTSDPPPPSRSVAALTCGAGEWNPSWRQGSGANRWWVEWEIGDATVTSAFLEVVGRGNVALSLRWNKWVGSTARIEPGTNVIVHATNAAGKTAKTDAFGYLVVTQPPTDCAAECVPNCNPVTHDCGDDGCGGDCGFCGAGRICENGLCKTSSCIWEPVWKQGSGANRWWVEYEIASTQAPVASAYLEVIGRGNVTLSSRWNKWVGSTARIEPGTSVIVHATNTAGQTSETKSFGYLVETQPTTDCESVACQPLGERCISDSACCDNAKCCNGTCAYLGSDQNCGSCGNACPSGSACFNCSDALVCLSLSSQIPDFCLR